MKTKYRNTSRRRTPWGSKENLTPLEDFIRTKYLDTFNYRHPKLAETSESELLNSYPVHECRICHSSHIVKRGFTKNGLQRYKCHDCKKTFTATTNTLFQDHKISISEWIEFCLEIMSYESTSAVSKNNKNSYTTSKYWLHKLFILLEDSQKHIILKGRVEIDETYFPVMERDRTKRNGKKLRGLSKDQYCIAIGYDGKYVYAAVEGKGKPSQKKTLKAYENHIEEKSLLIHDKEKSHRILVKKLSLEEEVYDSNELKKLEDKDNPLKEVNHICYLLKRFLRAHGGFSRDELEDYINLFCFIYNPPEEKLEKVKKLLDSAMHFTKSIKFRDLYTEK